MGATGIGFSRGLSAWWWVGSAGIGTLVLGLWLGPRIWTVARDHDLYTAGDFLEHRYGSVVRGILAVLLWVGTLAILAGQLVALAWVLNVVAGIPKALGCLIGGVVMTTYFAAGGLFGSAWVNLVQLGALLAGFGVAVPVALAGTGGMSGLIEGAREIDPGLLDFWSGGAGGGLYYLALLAPAFMVSPGLLQKVFGAKDRRTVRTAVGTSAVVLMLFAFVPALLGLIARVEHPGLENPELALPTLLVHNLSPLLGGLGLGALFVADVSSADAILFMLSTSLSKDLYKRFLKPEASDSSVLAVARLAAVLGGGLGVALAIISPSVVSALSIFYSMLGVSLFVPVVAGLYQRKAGALEALGSVAAGVMIYLGVRFGLLSWPSTANALGLIAATAAFGLLLVTRGVLAKPQLPEETRKR